MIVDSFRLDHAHVPLNYARIRPFFVLNAKIEVYFI